MIKADDICRVTIDWGDGDEKKKTVRIIRLQKNGDRTFARVMWQGKDGPEMGRKYGDLFEVETELVAIGNNKEKTYVA